MQGLPLLSEIFPDHWLFSDHPNADEMDDPTGQSQMHRWFRLQRSVYASAVASEDEHNHSGLSGAIQWVPHAEHLKAATALEATWLNDHKVPEDCQDPVAARARIRNYHRANSNPQV